MTPTTPPKVALITGFTGQNGACSSELLGDRPEACGIKRRSDLLDIACFRAHDCAE